MHPWWRTGRHNDHTIYVQEGAEPSRSDPFLGSLNFPEASALAVEAVNALTRRTHNTSTPRTFKIHRQDHATAHGEGVVFTDGTCSVRWLEEPHTTSWGPSLAEALDIGPSPDPGSHLVWNDTGQRQDLDG